MIKDKLLVKCPFVHTMELLETVDGREIFKLKIGHMRADYANGRWYNTIWPCHDELCTPEIAREIDSVYEELISSQCFPDLKSSAEELRKKAQGKIFKVGVDVQKMLKPPFYIIREEFEEGQQWIRVLSEHEQPGTLVSPNLEDGYLLCVRRST